MVCGDAVREREAEYVPYEQLWPLSIGGFKYEFRILTQPVPRMAPILLLGGAFQDMHSWVRHETGLCPLATVITVDLPGTGGADILPAGYGMGFLADAVHHMVEEARLAPLNVMGGSYGGRVALELAQRHPADVARLLLCGIAMEMPDPVAAWIRHTTRQLRTRPVDDFIRDAVATLVCQDPNRTVRRRAGAARLLERQLRALTQDGIDKYIFNTERLLSARPHPHPAPACPTLFVTGEHDMLTTPQLCRAAAATYPGAGYALMREADHLFPLTRPEEFVDLLITFFTGGHLDELPYLMAVQLPAADPHPS